MLSHQSSRWHRQLVYRRHAYIALPPKSSLATPSPVLQAREASFLTLSLAESFRFIIPSRFKSLLSCHRLWIIVQFTRTRITSSTLMKQRIRSASIPINRESWYMKGCYCFDVSCACNSGHYQTDFDVTINLGTSFRACLSCPYHALLAEEALRIIVESVHCCTIFM